MQKERSEQEHNISHLKEQVSHQRESIIQTQTKLAEMDGVQAQLELYVQYHIFIVTFINAPAISFMVLAKERETRKTKLKSNASNSQTWIWKMICEDVEKKKVNYSSIRRD